RAPSRLGRLALPPCPGRGAAALRPCAAGAAQGIDVLSMAVHTEAAVGNGGGRLAVGGGWWVRSRLGGRDTMAASPSVTERILRAAQARRGIALTPEETQEL